MKKEERCLGVSSPILGKTALITVVTGVLTRSGFCTGAGVIQPFPWLAPHHQVGFMVLECSVLGKEAHCAPHSPWLSRRITKWKLGFQTKAVPLKEENLHLLGKKIPSVGWSP